MPAVSVIVPTTRIGGLDLLFDSLTLQTFQDFELILVDGLYDYRCLRLWAKANYPQIRLTHVPPREKAFPMNAYCQYMNTGLVHTNSPYILTLCDYSYLDPNCLGAHVEFLNAHPRGVAVLAPYIYTALPRLRSDLPTYSAFTMWHGDNPQEHEKSASEAADRYVEDLKNGRLNLFMTSIFEGPLSLEDILKLPVEYGATGVRESLFSHCHLKNECYATEDVLDVNGWNEDLDKSHGWQDTDFAIRLSKLGVNFNSLPIGQVYVVNPRSILYARKIERPWHSNIPIYEAMANSPTCRANPGFDLRGIRTIFERLKEQKWL